MELKFVGPKPMISATGITFDNNKEDKFVYLNITAQLIRALDHDYIEGQLYRYDTRLERLDSDEIMRIIKHYRPDIMEKAEARVKKTEAEIDDQIARSSENRVLGEIERGVLKRNLEMMREYLLQRSFNKFVYYSAIEILSEIVRRDHIDYITAPMYEKFVHIFHTLEGVLRHGKKSVGSDMEIYSEEGVLTVKLDVRVWDY